MKNLFLLLLLGACANMGPLDQKKVGQVDKVGLVYAVGDDLHVLNQGLTVFDNKTTDLDVANWGLAGIAFDELASRLKSEGKTAVPLTTDADLAKDVRKEGDFKKAMDAARAQGARYVLILTPARHDYYPYPEGASLFCREVMGFDGKWQMQLQLHAALWDVEKKEKIYQTVYLPNDKTVVTTKLRCHDLDIKDQAKLVSTFKGELQDQVRKATLHVLHQSHLVKGKPKTVFEQ